MIKNPLISVIIPVYNVEDYLEECVNSITQQTYTNLEIILIDDGSTDNSLDVCNRCAGKDNRIQVVHQKNSGQGVARNTGLAQCSGELIHFMDSDDYLSVLDLYQQAVDVFNTTKVNCFQFKINPFCDDESQEQYLQHLRRYYGSIYPTTEILDTKEYSLIELMYKTLVSVCNKIFQRNMLLEEPFENEHLKNEDEGFWAYFLAHTPILYNSQVVAYERRVHGNSTMGNIRSNNSALMYEHNFDIFRVLYRTYIQLCNEGLSEEGSHVYARLIRMAYGKRKDFDDKNGFDHKLIDILGKIPLIPIELITNQVWGYYIQLFCLSGSCSDDSASLLRVCGDRILDSQRQLERLERAYKELQASKWVKFGNLPRKQKIRTLGKMVLKKLRIHKLVKPIKKRKAKK